jgi:hypothetical protein
MTIHTNKKRDSDGMLVYLKPILDGAVQAKTINDDNYKYIRHINSIIERDGESFVDLKFDVAIQEGD